MRDGDGASDWMQARPFRRRKTRPPSCRDQSVMLVPKEVRPGLIRRSVLPASPIRVDKVAQGHAQDFGDVCEHVDGNRCLAALDHADIVAGRFSARADFVLAEAQFGASFPDIPCDDIPCVHPPQVDKGRDSSLPNIFGFRHSRPSAGI